MNYDEAQLALFYTILSEIVSGSIGPEQTAGACYVKLRDITVGPKLPISIAKTECQRIGLIPEEKADGWHLDLNNCAQLVALAWGDDVDDEYPLRDDASEDFE